MKIPIKHLLCSAILAAHTSIFAGCALSTTPHPHGLVGLQLFHADDARSWEWADDLGVPWVRVEARVDWFNPYQNRFDFDYLDRVFSLSRKYPNIKVLLLLNHAPTWFAHDDFKGFAMHSANAASALARRYRPDGLEVFNEPNLPLFGWVRIDGGAQASAGLYSKTIAAVSSAVRNEDKKTLIVTGGLSPQNDPETYLRWVVRLTPPSCYDLVGLHPYGESGKFGKVQNNLALLLRQENRPDKQAWMTEYGTLENAKRADLITQLFKERDGTAATFWFTERDFDSADGTYGLRERDGTAKPEYQVFKSLMNRSHP